MTTQRDMAPCTVQRSRAIARLLTGIARGAILAATVAGTLACGPQKTVVSPRLANEMPQKILWAWERPEDLRFADPSEFGVAFLAQTIFLEQDRAIANKRRQPLEIAPGAYVIAVTRIETNKDTFKRSTMSDEIAQMVAHLVRSTLDLPEVRGIQIDFDAVSSERKFYRKLMTEVRRQTPEGVTLTMTSLASWCTGDAWFNDFPVDEAVPMAFRMGADEEKVRTFVRNGNDWHEPLCRGSYGISIDDPPLEGIKPARRLYFFSNDPWRQSDLEQLR